MKKLILSLAILFSCSWAALAQMPSFHLGIKGGVNASHLKTKEPIMDGSSTMGYQIGAWARLGGASFYVQPELYLGSKGGASPLIISSYDALKLVGKAKFTTLDLPVLLGTKIGPGKFNVRFMAGPVISFVLDEKVKSPDLYDANPFSLMLASFSFPLDYKKQTWGLQAGTGVDMGSLSVDLRYEAGLTNVIKNHPTYNQKQNLFHLSLGFKVL
ncbi:MAG TPA: porin family protein [Daejeonella sp.]|nr:porin family protein [Daejeonella sp.]